MALVVVQGFDLVSDFLAQLENCGPFFRIFQLFLHSCPKRLGHGILETFPHRFEVQSEPVFVAVAGVCPGRAVGPVVCADDCLDCWWPTGIRHEHSRFPQSSLWPSINRPTHGFAESDVSYDARVNGAFFREMFRDSRRP